ncbi:MAG: transcription antitermination factor NusB [Selenomonas sp.]|uniref:transcription antitermination factor NusB n=1 Tax=Selenomonas sp. TaxID=2053611 RepID=UPI0025EED0DC|nr:transcription antitermination factor NusB [Selenomonas sp.]MCI6099975.1 transcription antitermination factor NusB [Selenomonas sp.]MCI6232969.1 transcription antitermination factor NusB [Selenomonas sp.]
MSRRQAREIALQALYQLDVNPPAEGADGEVLALDAALDEAEEDVSAKTRDYAAGLVHGTRRYLSVLDEAIGAKSKGWKVARMAVIDRNIARMAVYEMKYAETAVDAGVAIDEAIELAKKYGADESPKFLNGVLGAMVQKGQKKSEKK